MFAKLAAVLVCVALASAASIERRGIHTTDARTTTNTWNSFFYQNDLVAIMFWDHTLSTATDLDLVAYYVTDNVNVANKNRWAGMYDGNPNGYVAKLGETAIQYYASGWSSTTSSSPALQFDATSTSSPAGVEYMAINGDMLGVFKFVVYDNSMVASMNRGTLLGLKIKLYSYSTGNTSPIVTVTMPSSSCSGRFWNAFTLNITGVSPLTFTTSVTNTVTATPMTTWGTTASQDFETQARATC